MIHLCRSDHHLLTWGQVFVRRGIDLQNRAATLGTLAIRLLLLLVWMVLVVGPAATLELLLSSHANRLLGEVLKLRLVCILHQAAVSRMLLAATTARGTRGLPDRWKNSIIATVLLYHLIFKTIGPFGFLLLDIDETIL